MKKFQTHLHKFFLLVSGLLVSPPLFAVTEAEAIWSYVFLIPLYFILILQSLLIVLALIMKQFKQKKLLLTSTYIGSIVIVLGLAVAIYFQSLINLGLHLLYFAALTIVVLVLPTIQYKLLKKDESYPIDE
jgi:hypothetical protein